MFLEGKKIFLRQIEEDDCENYFEKLNDQNLTKYMQHGIWPKTLEEVKEYSRNVNGFLLGIFDKKSKRHYGNISLFNYHQFFRSAEISIFVWQQKKGFGTEAIGLLTDHAFKRMNIHRLQMGTACINEPCIKAFEKNGYEFEARLRDLYYLNGCYQDVLIYSQIRHGYY